MSMFVLTLTGFAGAMGIPVFLTAAAESAAPAVTRGLHPQAKAIAKRPHSC